MPNAAAIPPARGKLATTSLAALPQPTKIGSDSTPSPSPAIARSDSIAVRTDSNEAARRIQQAAIRRVLANGGPEIVYQPQLSLSRLVVEGYEALARFPETPIRGTESWFARAHELGLGAALEASALEQALRRRHERPAGSVLAVNVSPGVLTSAAVTSALPADLTGIEIELTEHEWVPGAGRLRHELDLLRERGARVAIDDVGVAHSGLRRVMELAPDRIKLDRHLVLGVSTNTAKAALIRALVDFAEHINATVCAEGVENIDDLEALADLDVSDAQGWAVGLPESDFRDAEPLALAASRNSLRKMLSGKATTPSMTAGSVDHRTPPVTAGSTRLTTSATAGPEPLTGRTAPSESARAAAGDASPTPRTHDSIADVEDLLTQLTAVTSLAELHTLAGTCAGVLGGDLLMISVLSGDGESVASVASVGNGSATGDVYELKDYPVTRRCLESRSVKPIYVGCQGDPAEWELLDQLGYGTALLVPIVSRDRVIGLLECYRRIRVPWTRRQIRSARMVAAMLGSVLDVLLTSTPAKS